jgi:hypothetical protein
MKNLFFLQVNLVQKDSAQLCHLSTQSPLNIMHLLQRFTNASISRENVKKEKASSGYMRSHSSQAPAVLQRLGKSFHQEPLCVAENMVVTSGQVRRSQQMRETLEMNVP